jgi:hypothetical protein
MTIDSAQLLRKLEPAVRPGPPAGATRPLPVPLERQGFDELLALVSRGGVSSARAVTIGAGANLERDLEPAQLERLAAAADLAEAKGSRRAVMLIDGRGLVMEVGAREIAAEMSAVSPPVTIDVDAAVYVLGEEDAAGRHGGALPLPGTGLVPPAIARHLEQLGSGAARGGTTAPRPSPRSSEPEPRETPIARRAS